MARTKKQKELLEVYFTPSAFIVEGEQELPEGPRDWMVKFRKDKYRALLHLGFLQREKWFSPGLGYLHRIAELLITKIGQQPDVEISRDTVLVDLDEDELEELINDIPFVLGMEYIDANWIQSLWETLLSIFRREIKVFDGTVSRYFAEHNSNINVVGRVFFHLVENKDKDFPFAFMATYSSKPVKSKRAVHTPLKNALREFAGEEKQLLSLIATVLRAAQKSNFISDLLESGELFSPLKLTVEEAHTVLKEITLYEKAGIMCRVPDWWRKKTNSLRLAITVGDKKPSRLGLDAILDFSLSLKIGDESLSEDELAEFLHMAEGLIKYKGKWVEINKDKLNALLSAFDKVKDLAKEGELSIGEAMRLELNGNKLLDIPEEEVEVSITNGEWLKTVKKDLSHPYH